MDETFNWFIKAELSKYEDKYISIVGKEVVCPDEDPEIAYTNAKKNIQIKRSYSGKSLMVKPSSSNQRELNSIKMFELVSKQHSNPLVQGTRKMAQRPHGLFPVQLKTTTHNESRDLLLSEVDNERREPSCHQR
ncbi:MAG TPA: hypothetical protein VMW89_10370 [Desulfatiglandales bacterium]|nr:hypothetical protein [Desulfatiglandales bacterium]